MANAAPTFGAMAGAEVLICGVGALVLGCKRLTRYIAPWICGVLTGVLNLALGLSFA